MPNLKEVKVMWSGAGALDHMTLGLLHTQGQGTI